MSEKSGRVALITGGAQGIGFATAKRFLADGFAGIMLLDRNDEGLSAARQRLGEARVQVLAADIRDPATGASAVAAALRHFGRLDVLVNAAGNTERWGLDDATPEAFDRMFFTNVKGPLFLMQEAVKPMRRQGSGVIVNVASMLAYGGPPNLIVYSASKAALNTLTRGVANTVKREGIRAFGINLGWVHTEGEQKLQTTFHGQPHDWAEAIGKRMPAGRMIVPDDVAGLMAYLVSPSAAMMNGAIIDYEQMPAGVFESHPALAPE